VQTRSRCIVLGFSLMLGPLNAGCATWSVVTPNPEDYVKTHSPNEVRVTGIDSSTIVLRAPQVRADSIVGSTGGGLRADDPLRMAGVPLVSVRTIEVRQSNTGGVLAGIGVAMVLGAVIFEANGGVMGDGWQ
jgi:hypothetical protein